MTVTTHAKNHILEGDALALAQRQPDASVHCIITSPPYWGLRDYGVAGQLGLEATPHEYIDRLVAVFSELRRVLHPTGTLWLNLGDSYANEKKWGGTSGGYQGQRVRRKTGLKPKDMVGIPWRVALALQADGWWLRSCIIWHKHNPMPESVRDRPTTAHEYIFLLTKAERYFYDAEAVCEPVDNPGDPRPFRNGDETTLRLDNGRIYEPQTTRNRRSVWPMSSQPYPGAHFAVFPPELPKLCIRAGSSAQGVCPDCGAPWKRVVEKQAAQPRPAQDQSHLPADGRRAASGHRVRATRQVMGWQPSCDCGLDPVPAVVLDPFLGSGTTAAVAVEEGRNYLGFELNPHYITLAKERIAVAQPALIPGGLEPSPGWTQLDLFDEAA